MATEGKVFACVVQVIADPRQHDANGKSAQILSKVDEECESDYDSHPPVRQRLSYAGSFCELGRCDDERPVRELFANLESRSLELADLLAADIAEKIGKPLSLEVNPA